MYSFIFRNAFVSIANLIMALSGINKQRFSVYIGMKGGHEYLEVKEALRYE